MSKDIYCFIEHSSVWGCYSNLVKWEYKVLPLKTKIHLSRHDREKNPTIEKVRKELNALGEEGWN